MAIFNSKKQPVIVTNDVTGEINEFISITKAAKFIGASLAHVDRNLIKHNIY